jgi:hypothetical protein
MQDDGMMGGPSPGAMGSNGTRYPYAGAGSRANSFSSSRDENDYVDSTSGEGGEFSEGEAAAAHSHNQALSLRIGKASSSSGTTSGANSSLSSPSGSASSSFVNNSGASTVIFKRPPSLGVPKVKNDLMKKRSRENIKAMQAEPRVSAPSPKKSNVNEGYLYKKSDSANSSGHSSRQNSSDLPPNFQFNNNGSNNNYTNVFNPSSAYLGGNMHYGAAGGVGGSVTGAPAGLYHPNGSLMMPGPLLGDAGLGLGMGGMGPGGGAIDPMGDFFFNGGAFLDDDLAVGGGFPVGMGAGGLPAGGAGMGMDYAPHGSYLHGAGIVGGGPGSGPGGMLYPSSMNGGGSLIHGGGGPHLGMMHQHPSNTAMGSMSMAPGMMMNSFSHGDEEGDDDVLNPNIMNILYDWADLGGPSADSNASTHTNSRALSPFTDTGSVSTVTTYSVNSAAAPVAGSGAVGAGTGAGGAIPGPMVSRFSSNQLSAMNNNNNSGTSSNSPRNATAVGPNGVPFGNNGNASGGYAPSTMIASTAPVGIAANGFGALALNRSYSSGSTDGGTNSASKLQQQQQQQNLYQAGGAGLGAVPPPSVQIPFPAAFSSGGGSSPRMQPSAGGAAPPQAPMQLTASNLAPLGMTAAQAQKARLATPAVAVRTPSVTSQSSSPSVAASSVGGYANNSNVGNNNHSSSFNSSSTAASGLGLRVDTHSAGGAGSDAGSASASNSPIATTGSSAGAGVPVSQPPQHRQAFSNVIDELKMVTEVARSNDADHISLFNLFQRDGAQSVGRLPPLRSLVARSLQRKPPVAGIVGIAQVVSSGSLAAPGDGLDPSSGFAGANAGRAVGGAAGAASPGRIGGVHTIGAHDDLDDSLAVSSANNSFVLMGESTSPAAPGTTTAGGGGGSGSTGIAGTLQSINAAAAAAPTSSGLVGPNGSVLQSSNSANTFSSQSSQYDEFNEQESNLDFDYANFLNDDFNHQNGSNSFESHLQQYGLNDDFCRSGLSAEERERRGDTAGGLLTDSMTPSATTSTNSTPLTGQQRKRGRPRKNSASIPAPTVAVGGVSAGATASVAGGLAVPPVPVPVVVDSASGMVTFPPMPSAASRASSGSGAGGGAGLSPGAGAGAGAGALASPKGKHKVVTPAMPIPRASSAAGAGAGTLSAAGPYSTAQFVPDGGKTLSFSIGSSNGGAAGGGNSSAGGSPLGDRAGGAAHNSKYSFRSSNALSCPSADSVGSASGRNSGIQLPAYSATGGSGGGVNLGDIGRMSFQRTMSTGSDAMLAANFDFHLYDTNFEDGDEMGMLEDFE